MSHTEINAISAESALQLAEGAQAAWVVGCWGCE